MASEKHKIYAFPNGGNPGFIHAVAIADDGNCLAGHCCSHDGFVPHDLGVTSTWKHDTYNAHFGEGNWEIEFVPYDQVESHEGLQAAFALNKKLAEEEEQKESEAINS